MSRLISGKGTPITRTRKRRYPEWIVKALQEGEGMLASDSAWMWEVI
ncbi:hypothetical protein [Thalassoglobus neptunius]|nr:hypothetical protein [Thalassoglobus neptunius]